MDFINNYAMFDGDTTRPTTLDIHYEPLNNANPSFTIDPAQMPAGKYKAEILIQETTGEEVGLNVVKSGGNFTTFPATVCTSPTWIESSRELNWRDGDSVDGTWGGQLIVNLSSQNEFVNIYAMRAQGQIITFARPTRINEYDEQANYRFYKPGTYTVKCQVTDTNGNVFNEEKVVTVNSYLPLKATNPRTDKLNVLDYVVEVVSSGGNDVFEVDGVTQKTINMITTDVVQFKQLSNSNNGYRPIRIYTDASKGTEITAGVTIRNAQGDTYFEPSVAGGAGTGTFRYESENHTGMGGDIIVSTTRSSFTTTYNVTVVNNYGNKYVIDGVQQDSLTMTAGQTYIFDQSDSSNSGHPLKIYTDSSKSTEVTAGVTISGNTTTFVPATPGTYSYQCAAHAGMGGNITVQ
jgi:plastocyanin